MYNTKSTPTSILWRDGAPCCPLEVDPPQGMSGDTCCRVPAEKDDTGPRASSTPNNDGKNCWKDHQIIWNPQQKQSVDPLNWGFWTEPPLCLPKACVAPRVASSSQSRRACSPGFPQLQTKAWRSGEAWSASQISRARPRTPFDTIWHNCQLSFT